MGKRFLKLKKRGNLLVFLVGQSGSGKNSFVEAMKLEDYQYEITGKVKQELKEKKQPINHDIIQPIMHKLYKEDPYWQIPYILSGLKKKGLLIVNGCRSFLEVKRLKDLCSLVLIVEIRASTSARRKRLRLRDGTSRQEFKKIENDEMRITSLPKILQEDFVDIVIMNNDSLATLKVKAKKFASLILSFNFERMKSKNER